MSQLDPKIALNVMRKEGARIAAVCKYVETLEQEKAKLVDLCCRLLATHTPVKVTRIEPAHRREYLQLQFDHPDSRVVHAMKETFRHSTDDPLLRVVEARFLHLKHREL